MRLSATTLTALAAVTLAQTAAAQIGTTYCSANPNSTGGISLISATGSTDVALNDVTLAVTNLPANSFGLFVTSQTQGFAANPGGSSGNLCVGGTIGRYQMSILNSGATGSVSLPIDLTNLPAPTFTYAAMPGDTINFQYWHRDFDSTGLTSNFSEGLEIQFDAPAGPTWSVDVWPMMTQQNGAAASCVDCHGIGGFGGLEMPDVQTAYNNILGIQSTSFDCAPQTYVIMGDPAGSLLYDKIANPTPVCGQQMPLFGTFAGDPDVIRDWILAGAPF